MRRIDVSVPSIERSQKRAVDDLWRREIHTKTQPWNLKSARIVTDELTLVPEDKSLVDSAESDMVGGLTDQSDVEICTSIDRVSSATFAKRTFSS